MSDWSDFEDEQAYADRLDQVIVRSGLCKVCAKVHSYDPSRPDHTPREEPMSWQAPKTWRLPSVEKVENALLLVLLLPLFLVSLTIKGTS